MHSASYSASRVIIAACEPPAASTRRRRGGRGGGERGCKLRVPYGTTPVWRIAAQATRAAQACPATER